MRFSGPVLVALLPTLAVAFPSSTREQLACLRLRSEDLGAEAACGSAVFIASHMRSLPDAWTPDNVRMVFEAAGCSPDDAAERGINALSRCSEFGDLRRREALVPANGWAPVVTPAPEFLSVDQVNDNYLRVRDTTAESDKSSTTSLKCSATRTESTTTCTQSVIGVETCKPIVLKYTKCAPGLICKPNVENVCMVAKTTLDTGGLIVTIFFAAFVALAIALITFMCCKERAMHKRLAAKAEAAEIAKEAAAANRKTRADTQPLMAAGSPAGPRSQSPGSPGGYAGHTENNPFNDGNRL